MKEQMLRKISTKEKINYPLWDKETTFIDT
jgi:hypothetical protein